ncbi:MAG: hypothetical protein U0572_10075 [Phycisphaerales bacterium]
MQGRFQLGAICLGISPLVLLVGVLWLEDIHPPPIGYVRTLPYVAAGALFVAGLFILIHRLMLVGGVDFNSAADAQARVERGRSLASVVARQPVVDLKTEELDTLDRVLASVGAGQPSVEDRGQSVSVRQKAALTPVLPSVDGKISLKSIVQQKAIVTPRRAVLLAAVGVLCMAAGHLAFGSNFLEHPVSLANYRGTWAIYPVKMAWLLWHLMHIGLIAFPVILVALTFRNVAARMGTAGRYTSSVDAIIGSARTATIVTVLLCTIDMVIQLLDWQNW